MGGINEGYSTPDVAIGFISMLLYLAFLILIIWKLAHQRTLSKWILFYGGLYFILLIIYIIISPVRLIGFNEFWISVLGSLYSVNYGRIILEDFPLVMFTVFPIILNFSIMESVFNHEGLRLNKLLKVHNLFLRTILILIIIGCILSFFVYLFTNCSIDEEQRTIAPMYIIILLGVATLILVILGICIVIILQRNKVYIPDLCSKCQILVIKNVLIGCFALVPRIIWNKIVDCCLDYNRETPVYQYIVILILELSPLFFQNYFFWRPSNIQSLESFEKILSPLTNSQIQFIEEYHAKSEKIQQTVQSNSTIVLEFSSVRVNENDF